VANCLAEGGYDIRHRAIIPDERSEIEEVLIRLADEVEINLIVTVGGTGFSLRDVTPEATIAVCDRMVPGIAEAMRGASLKITPRAMLSRGQAGIRKTSLIVNLPGGPKAAVENLLAVLPVLGHGIDILLGSATECARE